MEQNEIFKGIQGKKIVVIGASSGIGFAVAKLALLYGADVIIASSNAARIKNALEQLPRKANGVVLNVNDEEAVKCFFAELGNFDHLVYTAGENIQLGLLADASIANNKTFFNTRYWGAVCVAKYAQPFVKSSIVFTGGIAANRPGAGWSLASSICGAMEGFTRALSIEMAPVRVNLVSPGIVETPLWDSLPEEDKKEMYAFYKEKLPVKFVAQPDDVAKTYLYFMQQQYVTGQVAIVDGGGVLV